MHWVDWERMDFQQQPQHEDVWVVSTHEEWGGLELPPVSGDVFWFGLDASAFCEGSAALGAPGLIAPCLVDLFLRCLGSDQFVQDTLLVQLGQRELEEAKRCADKVLRLGECFVVDGSPAADVSKALHEYEESIKASHIGLPFDGNLEPIEWQGPVPRSPGEKAPMEPTTDEQQIVWNRIFLAQASRALDMCMTSVDRLWIIARLARQARVCEPAVKFLQRVSRCYVWGFEPECVILCRSVLDAAFREAISDEDCMGVGLRGEKTWHGMADRIVAAQKKGRISELVRKQAFDVKDRGDKAIHYDPIAPKDVLGTIERTLDVLVALHESRS